MRNLPLMLVVNDSDQVRDIVNSTLSIPGVRLTCLTLPVEEIFFRFTRFREWDISEFSLAKYANLRASGDQGLIAIPVFTSRAFRHSAIYIHPERSVREPAELRGKTVGVPEWSQT